MASGGSISIGVYTTGSTFAADGSAYYFANEASRIWKLEPCNHPPDCAGASAARPELWPPNHELQPVSVTGVADPDGDPISITVDQVTQDEPLDGLGDGDTAPDAVLQGAAQPVLIRSERSGLGNGRVYRIRFTATDQKGGNCSGTAALCVPHDHRPGVTCIDDGQNYLSE